jgi:hypothetical protein
MVRGDQWNNIETLRKDFYTAYGIVINGDQDEKG